MATIYEFKIKTVSAFCAHPKDDVKKLIEDFIKNYKFENGLGFESTEITDVCFCNARTKANVRFGARLLTKISKLTSYIR